MNETVNAIKQQHYKVAVFRSFIKYVEDNYPEVDLKTLVEQCGVEYDYLSNEHNWVSAEFENRFTKKLIELTGDSKLSYKVGLAAIDIENIGSAQYYVMKYILPLSTLLEKMSDTVSRFNRVLKTSVNRISDSYEVIFEVDETLLNKDQIPLVEESFPSMCENIKGNLVGLCKLKKNKHLKVTYEIYPESSKAKFEVKGNVEDRRVRTPLVASSVLTAVLTNIFCTIFDLSLIANMCYTIGGLTFGYLVADYALAKIISKSTNSALQLLDEKYSEAISLNEKIEVDLKKEKLFTRLSNELVLASNYNKFFELTDSFLQQDIGAKNILFLEHKSDQKKMVSSYVSKNIDKQLYDIISNFELDTTKKNVSEQSVPKLFESKKAVIINNVHAFSNQLTDADSKKIMDLVRSEKIGIFPIYTNTNSFGSMLVNFKNSLKFSDSEIISMMSIITRMLSSYLQKEFAFREKIKIMNLAADEREKTLARTTHELKTPLHGIIGLASNILNGSYELSDDVLEHVSLIEDSGKRLSSLVGNILQEKSKINKEQIIVSDISIINSIKKCAASIQILANEHNTNLKLELGEDIYVKANEDKLQQVLINIFGNAIKFSSDGNVRIYMEQDVNIVTLICKDDGIGIPQEDISKIYNEFYQASNNTYNQGHGMGLNIAKNLIEYMGGSIKINSEAGAGTEVLITLLRSEAKVLPASREAQISPYSTEKPMVYIADDENINLKMLEGQLKILGFNYKSFNDGISLLNYIKKGRKPDAIILDKMMPVLSGDETLSQLRSTYNSGQLPVIMLTAKTDIESLRESFERGASDYIIKGDYTQIELKSRLDRSTALSRLYKSYDRLIPRKLLDNLGHDTIEKLKPGDSIESNYTVMFLDIRDFTKISNTKSPSEITSFLINYYNRILPIIYKHDGFVDKIVGDQIMAVFSNTNKCVQASSDIDISTANYNLQSGDFIKIGIGIHNGPTSVSAIGNEQYLNLTLIGDTVNKADRFEKQTKLLDAPILISESVYTNLEKNLRDECRYLGEYSLKGIMKPEKHFEFVNYSAFKSFKDRSSNDSENFLDLQYKKKLDSYNGIATFRELYKLEKKQDGDINKFVLDNKEEISNLDKLEYWGSHVLKAS